MRSPAAAFALAIWMLGSGILTAQPRSWIFFTDQGDRPGVPALSEAALARRARAGLQPGPTDRPLAAPYLDSLRALGIQPHRQSRWFNAVSAALTPEQALRVQALPFVRSVEPVRGYGSAAGAEGECPDGSPDDAYWRQLQMIGADVLHRNGYTGRGVRVAVFDNGFVKVDSLAAFRHLFEEGRILATRDYVSSQESVFDPCIHCRHGSQVFSILAANWPGRLTGAAPGASFILLRTENDSSETRQEEDNWVAAAEFADSLGADIFSTSLGYLSFDNGDPGYSRSDLDGQTALITRAADLAAAKGILVVNSAGNEGTRGLVAPADGDSVLAIGAVDACGELAAFSSRGPAADGRIKPDLAAMGEQTFFVGIDGTVRRGNGTSYACPLISGLAACLKQAHPQATAWQLAEALRRSADRFTSPGNSYGYGIPDGARAFRLLAGRDPAIPGLPEPPAAAARFDPEAGFLEPFAQDAVLIFPNPAPGSFRVLLPPGEAGGFGIRVVDLLGRTVDAQQIPEGRGYHVRLTGPFRPGLYAVQVLEPESGALRYQAKVMVE
ncbi:MAG: S8 family serine peptidase [Bacteroidia bacterium]|nr:S8 family serine peptidase [Bacteroidia bacterium]